jgi:AraC-like DNA-binding protein
MQEARILLEKTETNVSETAWQVGYVNVSHFSAAFKKRFGILPKHYLKIRLKDLESSTSVSSGSPRFQ